MKKNEYMTPESAVIIASLNSIILVSGDGGDGNMTKQDEERVNWGY